MRNVENIVNNAISSEQNFCEGFFTNSQNNYILGVNFSVAKTKIKLSHKDSLFLDEINAFDLAEIVSGHMGQINMITVSSFCGPKGLIWGYDICKTKKIKNPWGIKPIGYKINIYDIENLLDAFKRLTGTIKQPRFPFLPGSHVPCATKSLKNKGECIIYSALGIGIPENRERNACLLMEDIGTIPLDTKSMQAYKKSILEKVSQSILEIGKNQNILFKEIFVGIKDIKIDKKEIGCALVASPYFCLAQDAIPKNKKLSNLSLRKWETFTKDNFLYKKS